MKIHHCPQSVSQSVGRLVDDVLECCECWEELQLFPSYTRSLTSDKCRPVTNLWVCAASLSFSRRKWHWIFSIMRSVNLTKSWLLNSKKRSLCSAVNHKGGSYHSKSHFFSLLSPVFDYRACSSLLSLVSPPSLRWGCSFSTHCDLSPPFLPPSLPRSRSVSVCQAGPECSAGSSGDLL